MKKVYKGILFLLVLIPSGVFAQTVNGTVNDSKGMPIPGANILVKNTANGTITDFNGKYTLSKVKQNDTLVYSYIGFKTQEIVFTGQASINVNLEESTSQLDQIVLIGYGATNRQDATGAVSQIKPEDFNQGAIVSPEELISGKTAGVRVTSSGGAPGSGSEIRIRGGSSLSANNSPLVVLDGVPLDQRGVQGVRNQLNAINPNNIKSFTILKDAAATAIYGSRASNGVILITTKKGAKNQDLKVEVDTKFGVANALDHVSVLNGDQFRNLIQNRNDTDPSLLGNANTDWQDEIYRTSYSTIDNITVSKGFANFYFRANYNHTSESGILKTDAYQRDGLDISMTQNLFDNTLKLTLNAKGSINKNNYADTGAIGAAVQFDPTQNIYDNSLPFGGYFEFNRVNSDGKTVAQNQATRNPLALLNLHHNRGTNKRTISNFNAEYNFPFIDGLKANANAAVDYSELDGFESRPVEAATNIQDIRYTNDYSGLNRNTLLDLYLNYKKNLDFLDTDVDLTAGHSYQEYFVSSDRVYTDANKLVTDPTIKDRNSLESYFARASFDIADKYLISGSFRRDGSSRFSKDNKWSSFPAISVGWKIKNEAFLKESDFVSELKLRAGYGETGNNEIGSNYGYLGIYTPSVQGASYQFGNQFSSTLRPEEYDSELKWEELKTYNVGVDFGFFNNRLSGSVDGYYRETNDLLAEVPVPAGANLSDRLITNVGTTTSKGIEVGLNGSIVKNKSFKWDLNYNITFQDLEITNLTLGNDPNFFIPKGGISGGVGNTVQYWKKGYDPSTFLVFQQVYDEQGAPIEGAYVDRNGDNQITEADKRAYKKASPDYFMGLTSTMSYKNFDLSFTFRGSFNNYVYNNAQSNGGYVNSAIVTPQPYYSNLDTNVLTTNFENSQFFSDYYVQKADFVKLDNISLSYLIPSNKFKVRASFTASNVLTITDYDGLDPEISNGIDNNFYPRSRSYVLGLNVSF